MAKAHIATGMAVAFTVCRPENLNDALPVITGAAMGCLICDLDCEAQGERADSSRWRIVTTLIAIAALIEDRLLEAGMWESFGQSGSYLWFAGALGFALICTFASVSSHRGFSHSLMALVLELACIWLVFPAATVPFAAAFLSHIALDIMNRRPVRILYPMKEGICLKWFYADRLANRVCEIAGCIWLAVAVFADFV